MTYVQSFIYMAIMTTRIKRIEADCITQKRKDEQHERGTHAAKVNIFT